MPINNRTSLSAKIFLIICILLGLFFYRRIGIRGFTYTDELIALSLAVYLFISLLRYQLFEKKMLNAFYSFIGIFFFYYVYSWVLSINPQGINTSFLIYIKPFLTFFCAYLIGFNLDNHFKKHISILAVVLSIACLGITVYGYMNPFFSHPAYMAMTVSALALFYYYTSKTSLKNTIISICIMAIALLSFRMKAVGFFIVFVLITLFYKGEVKIKYSVRNTLLIISAIALVLYKAKDKLYFYFFNPYNENNLESSGRAALYVTAPDVLNDYFPFGPGFATYADFASAEFYSPLYYKYHLDMVYGLSPYNHTFICDAFYTGLAQFGYVGIFLFFYFWYWIYGLLKSNYKKNGNVKLYKVGLLIIAFFMIESTTATTFVQAQGLIVMLLLAIILYEGKYNPKSL